MPVFGVAPEDVKQDSRWPIDDPACWEFGVNGTTRRFMLSPTATVSDGQYELAGIENKSDTERVSAMLYEWRTQMASRVVETVDSGYNDYATSHGLPEVEGRSALLDLLDGYNDDDVTITWITSYTNWAQEQVGALAERVAKKASKKKSGGRTLPR